MKRSVISIVGAGPGDPDLITVKGLKAIQCADAILYDALCSKELLDLANPGAELIYVGKRCGRHSLKQEDINALIVSMSEKYKHIVRLKGGDPFVFGRGHEELEYLKKLDFKVTVIPGVSSATGLPLLQHVPLTRRNIAESFWVLTGTTKNHRLSADISLAARSQATLVILMGMRKLGEICEIFRNTGKSDLPVMIISNGSTAREKISIGVISDIEEKTNHAGIASPGIIVIGEVVSLTRISFTNMLYRHGYK